MIDGIEFDSEEYTIKVRSIADKLATILDDEGSHPFIAIDAIGAVVATIMAGAETRDDAATIWTHLNDSIKDVMNILEESGMTPWDRGTPN